MRLKAIVIYGSAPKTRFNHEADASLYAARSSHVVVRHVSGDRIVGFIEIVSRGHGDHMGYVITCRNW